MRDITPTFAGSEEKTWLTPKHIIDALGHFDLDPCVPDFMPWRTAARMVTKDEDGLTVDWNGKRVWLNPPYGLPSIPFLQKMSAHEGGASRFSSRVPTRATSMTSSARRHIRFSSFAVASSS